MKKLYMTLLYVIIFFTPYMNVYGEVIVGNLTFRCDSYTKEATVVKCNESCEGNVVIPNNVVEDGTVYSVTTIGSSAFKGCATLTSVEIPNSVTTLCSNAFNGCDLLSTIKIPSSVSKIYEDFLLGSGVSHIVVDGKNQFYDSRGNCNAIIEKSTNTLFVGCENTIIPNDVVSIRAAFYGRHVPTSVYIPSSVTSMEYAFLSCEGIETIKVDSNNKYYDSRDNCNAIIETSTDKLILGCASTIIPNSVKSIARSAFNQTPSSIEIPSSVTSIDINAFSGCADVRTVKFMCPNINGFRQCYNLQTVVIMPGAQTIGDYAFYGCTNLPSVKVPNGVTTVGDNAFYCCFNLSSIELPNSVISIGNYAFYTCVALTSMEIPSSVKSIGKGAFYMSTLTSISIPDSIQSIGEKAFYGCIRLASIVCKAKKVPVIGESCFGGVDNMIPVYVPYGSIEDYRTDSRWGTFKNFQYLPADPIDDELEEPKVTTKKSSAIVSWPGDEQVGTYTVQITKGGESICTAVFDAEGNVITISVEDNGSTKLAEFRSSYISPKGFCYEFTGLEEGTEYEYVVTTKNVLDVVLAEYSGTFKTMGVLKYDIRFVNYDGTELQSSKVEYGSMPTYTGDTPTKPSDAENKYTFVGWSPDITVVTSAQTYTAQFINSDYVVFDACDNMYNCVKIGGQWWMAENMRCNKYDTQSERAGLILETSELWLYAPYYTDASDKSNWKQEGYSDNLSDAQVEKLGYLYNWAAAVGLATEADVKSQTSAFDSPRQGICPNGWHVPTRVEFESLVDYIETKDSKGDGTAGKHLKTASGWYSGNGIDAYSYAALPAGYAGGSSVLRVGRGAYFWTATPSVNMDDYADYCMFYDYDLANINGGLNRYANSVRCVKNSTANKYTVTLSGINCDVTGDGVYDYGTVVELKATPNECTHFIGWSDGEEKGTRTITVTGDVTLTATAETNEGNVVCLNADVDYLQATYSTKGGKSYYNFQLQNYDTKLPSLALETEATSKTHIKGIHSVITDDSSLEVDDGEGFKTLSISDAALSFSFVRADTDGFSVYDVKITAVASDCNTYTYDSSIVVNAFDADDGYAEIVLEDDEPTSVLESESSSAINAKKYFENGRVVIERDGNKFDLRGVGVR